MTNIKVENITKFVFVCFKSMYYQIMTLIYDIKVSIELAGCDCLKDAF